MNSDDLPRDQADIEFARLSAQAGRRPQQTPEEMAFHEAERERISRQLIEDSRRNDARRRFEAGCPGEFRASDWEFPAIQPYRQQIDRVLTWQLHEKKGILASGPTGRRKTGSMWALMRRITCEEGRDVRFYSAFDFFGELQDQVKYGRDEARGWIETLARRPLVFIDDYGQTSLLKSKEDWALGWFFRFLDIRANEHLPLFVTTNLNAEAIAGGDQPGQVRGDPLLRRLLMVCEPVRFETEDEIKCRKPRR